LSLSLFSILDSLVSNVSSLQSWEELSIAYNVVVVVDENVRLVSSGYPGNMILLSRLPSGDRTATSPFVSKTTVRDR
jgi:hypothetical protein